MKRLQQRSNKGRASEASEVYKRQLTDPKPSDLTQDKEDDDKAAPYVIDRMQFKRDYSGYLDRRRTHVYVVAPGAAAPTQLTFDDFDDSDPVWRPDGRSIAFVSDRSDDPDLNYGTPRTLLPSASV